MQQLWRVRPDGLKLHRYLTWGERAANSIKGRQAYESRNLEYVRSTRRDAVVFTEFGD